MSDSDSDLADAFYTRKSKRSTVAGSKRKAVNDSASDGGSGSDWDDDDSNRGAKKKT